MIREYKENSDELFQFCDEEKYLLRGGSDDQVKIQSLDSPEKMRAPYLNKSSASQGVIHKPSSKLVADVEVIWNVNYSTKKGSCTGYIALGEGLKCTAYNINPLRI